MTLPALAIRNHRFTQVIVALVAALGLLSFFTMPRTEDPVFELPMATVVVVFPGADPEVIEALAVDPLEEAIDELDDLKTLETSIEDGVAVLSAEMLSGTSSDDAYDAVLQKVNEVRGDLPAEVRSVDVIQPSLSDVTVLQLALVEARGEPLDVDAGAEFAVGGDRGRWSAGGVDRVRRAAEALEREIEGVTGVKAVDTWGVRRRAGSHRPGPGADAGPLPLRRPRGRSGPVGRRGHPGRLRRRGRPAPQRPHQRRVSIG